MLWVLGYVMDNCVGFGRLLCLGIIILGFGKCFVCWIIVFLLGSALCIGIFKS